MVGIVYIIGLFLVSAVVLMIGEKIWSLFRRKPDTQRLVQERERRLSSPDWNFYAAHLGRPVPDSIRALYSDTDLLAGGDIQLEKITITSFEPIDIQGLRDTKVWTTKDAVAIARWEADPIYLMPGPDEDNGVYITYHDGGETELVADDVGAFISEIRASWAARIAA